MSLKADYQCPKCGKHVGKPRTHPEQCPHCETRLIPVRVIGDEVTYVYYRVKQR